LFHVPRFTAKIALGAGALVLGDIVTGLAAFSSITAASLWMFSVGWIHLYGEYSVMGRSFGTPGQLDLAWFGAVAGLPLLVGVVYLGIVALRLPLGLFRRARAA
jgi:hypothetical protein